MEISEKSKFLRSLGALLYWPFVAYLAITFVLIDLACALAGFMITFRTIEDGTRAFDCVPATDLVFIFFQIPLSMFAIWTFRRVLFQMETALRTPGSARTRFWKSMANEIVAMLEELRLALQNCVRLIRGEPQVDPAKAHIWLLYLSPALSWIAGAGLAVAVSMGLKL